MGGYRNVSEQTPFVPRDMEIGMIAIWSGTLASIPARYQLCDGTNGTPDLRERFVFGAKATLPPGNFGGVTTHSHSFIAAPHNHDVGAGTDWDDGSAITLSTQNTQSGGTTDPDTNMPPWYALAYIQKMS